jgi:ribosomal protein S18 acetylase RimI-like enzyme
VADLPEILFKNPWWHALQTRHRHFAISAGDACRYPGEVVPFAAVKTSDDPIALQHLRTLLAPGESVWMAGKGPASEKDLECLQLVLPEDFAPPEPHWEPMPLTAADAPDMVALTTLAFPGYFRIRTIEMGNYFGFRVNGRLIAMGGERLALEGYTEISAVCTHPDHRGKGYAQSIMWHLVRKHRRAGQVSWLHVGAANHRAIQLYRSMGFQIVRSVTLHQVSKMEL